MQPINKYIIINTIEEPMTTESGLLLSESDSNIITTILWVGSGVEINVFANEFPPKAA